jgi:hypothetical protein
MGFSRAGIARPHDVWSTMKQTGLEESGARTEADAKRPKSIVFEGAQRLSLIDFSGAEADVSLSLHSRDFFGSFLDPAKNEHQRVG